LEFFLQTIINGIVTGLIYALTAAGFTIIYGNAKILYLALGENFMLGAIGMYFFVEVFKIPYFLSLVIVIIILGLLGLIVEYIVFRHLKSSELGFAIATLAIGILITGICLELFGGVGRGITFPWSVVFRVGGIVITSSKLTIILGSCIIISALHLFFRKTAAGRAIRCVSEDRDTALLMGMSINKTNAMTFFIAFAIAGLAGALQAPLFYVDPFIGIPIFTITLIVVALGGLGNFVGAVVGGLLVGFIESIGVSYIGGITSLITFIIVIIVLIIKPKGLLS